MNYLPYESEYSLSPKTEVKGFENAAAEGAAEVARALREAMRGKRVLVADCYPGTDQTALLAVLEQALPQALALDSSTAFYAGEELTRRMETFLTEDRVRGRMFYGTLHDFVDAQGLEALRREAAAAPAQVIVCGVGASLVAEADVLVVADVARWEIQKRYRRGMPNFNADNGGEDILRKYKRGFFVEWRFADRHKLELLEKADFYLDGNQPQLPKMVPVSAFLAGLSQLVCQPFRAVPYFDPGVWGGQWMKEVCRLDPAAYNYAWSFDGVLEENSLLLQYGEVVLETPAINAVKRFPRRLMGEKSFARFGAEFPIRFDLLDTMDGQNLSLQVHPDTEYIKEHYGMTYTQDESYYILDCAKDGGVFLGLKKDVNPEEMVDALRRAQKTNTFCAEKYVNFFPAKKHDHFLIPAGTVHCSSRGCMVLEVSATPYIFTFKLWDWDRVGLDGLARPIHIEDGKNVIRYERDTAWVEQNLINRFELLQETPEGTEVKTGLHELEFIETHVYTTTAAMRVNAGGEFSMLNLVEGRRALVESPEDAFAPFEVHYAETFIVPAGAGNFILRSADGQPIRVLRAFVRHGGAT